MTIIYFISVLVAIITYLMVVADMFKKKVSRGFLGLFFFPLTYYHAIKYYSGNKKVVATLLWTSSIIVLCTDIIIFTKAHKDLEPFNDNVAAKLNMNCKTQNNISNVNGVGKYLVICTPSKTDESPYKDVEDMVKGYQVKFIEPMLPIYKKTTHLDADRAVIIGINSPFNVYACFEINNEGVIANSWNTDQKKPCDTSVVRRRDWDRDHPRLNPEEWQKKHPKRSST